MEFVKLLLREDRYRFGGASSAGMAVLGRFFYSDLGCFIEDENNASFKGWVLANKQDSTSGYNYVISGNTTMLDQDEDGKTVHFTDITSSGNEKPALNMLKSQLLKLLDEWQEKVCKLKPKEVIIKFQNGEFSLETKD